MARYRVTVPPMTDDRLASSGGSDREKIMAKGQMHSNKEIRKPKADKAKSKGQATATVTEVFTKTAAAATHEAKKKAS
jgi:hypothetical protein